MIKNLTLLGIMVSSMSFGQSPNRTTMEYIKSNDRTVITCQKSGQGPPLILVHGTSGTSARWKNVIPALEKKFTVYALDRRGREKSGDTEPYTIQKEFEDIAAVVNHISQPVYLLGHSYGAICSLEAMLLTSNVKRLILYEPPIPNEVQVYTEETIKRLDDLLKSGNREAVVNTFMLEVVRMPDHEFELFKSSPAYPSRVAAAHTLPRELRAHQNYKFDPERFKNIKTPVLLLLGGDSPPMFPRAIELVASALPNHEIQILDGQQHIAMDTAPELFVKKVMEFLDRD